ncbi:MAG: hypothetical protein AB7F65_00660 [Dehalococcoidia bacterium]
MSRDRGRDVELDAIEDDDRPWGAPAPVVTDEGVYGTIPARQRVFREYQREERPWRDTWVRLAGMAFAVIAGLWLVLLSGSEATGDEVARPALESMVETMTGLPGLLELHAAEITVTGGDVAVPGYPLPVTIPDAEVPAGPDRWREVILEQSSALLYVEGPDALAGESGAEGGGTFSTAGGTKLLMSNLSESRHSSFAFLLWPLGLVAVAAGLATVAGGSSFGRFTALGIATAAAGVPALVVGALSWAIVVFVGSDGSALAEVSHEIAAELAWLPIRNGLTFIVVGLLVALAARVVAVFFPAPHRSIVPAAAEE